MLFGEVPIDAVNAWAHDSWIIAASGLLTFLCGIVSCWLWRREVRKQKSVIAIRAHFIALGESMEDWNFTRANALIDQLDAHYRDL